MFEWKTQVPFPPIKPAWPEPVTALALAHVLSESFGSSPKRLGGASSVTGPHRETGMRQMSHYVYHDRDIANCLKVIFNRWCLCKRLSLKFVGNHSTPIKWPYHTKALGGGK